MRSTKVRIPALSTKNGSRIQAVILSSNSRSYQLYHKSFPFPNRTAQSENTKLKGTNVYNHTQISQNRKYEKCNTTNSSTETQKRILNNNKKWASTKIGIIKILVLLINVTPYIKISPALVHIIYKQSATIITIIIIIIIRTSGRSLIKYILKW